MSFVGLFDVDVFGVVPYITVLAALALTPLLVIWGIVRLFVDRDDPVAKAQAKRFTKYAAWGFLGVVMVIVVFGALRLMRPTFL